MSATGLRPLRWRLVHDATISGGGQVHRLDCPHAPAGAKATAVGTIVKRHTALRTDCSRCRPEVELLLG